MTEETIEQIKQNLDDVLDIQCSDGNWDYDPYMHGMANGLILAKSIVTGKDTDFLEAPERFLAESFFDRAARKLTRALRKLKPRGEVTCQEPHSEIGGG